MMHGRTSRPIASPTLRRSGFATTVLSLLVCVFVAWPAFAQSPASVPVAAPSDPADASFALDPVRGDIAAAAPVIQAILGRPLGWIPGRPRAGAGVGPPSVELDTPEASRALLTGPIRALADRDPAAAAATVDLTVRAGLIGRLDPDGWRLAVVPTRAAALFQPADGGPASPDIRRLMVVHDVTLMHALRAMRWGESVEAIPGDDAMEASKATAAGIALFTVREFAGQAGLDPALKDLEGRMFAGIPAGPIATRDPQRRFRAQVRAGAAFVAERVASDGTAAIDRMLSDPPLVMAQIEQPALWDLPVTRRPEPARLFRGFGRLLDAADVPGTVVLGTGDMAAETVTDLGPEIAREVAAAVTDVRTWYALASDGSDRRVRSASLYRLAAADDMVLDHMVALAERRQLGGGTVRWTPTGEVPGLEADSSRLLQFTVQANADDEVESDRASGLVAFARRGTQMVQIVASVDPPGLESVANTMELLFVRAERGDELVPVAPRPPGAVTDTVAAIEAALSDDPWVRDESAMDVGDVASLFGGNLQLAGTVRRSVRSARELQWTAPATGAGSAPRSVQVLVVESDDPATATAMAEVIDQQQARRVASFAAALESEMDPDAAEGEGVRGMVGGRQGLIAGPADGAEIDPADHDTIRIWRRSLRLTEGGNVRLIELYVATRGPVMVRFATDGRVFAVNAPELAIDEIMAASGG